MDSRSLLLAGAAQAARKGRKGSSSTWFGKMYRNWKRQRNLLDSGVQEFNNFSYPILPREYRV